MIASPSLALVLMMLGIYGLLFEFSNPGYVLPGVVGGICLLLGAVCVPDAPDQLRRAGAHRPRHGVSRRRSLPAVRRASLGVGGVIAFVVGAIILVDTDIPGYGIPLPLIFDARR